LGDIWPIFGVFGIHFEPFLQTGFGIGFDGVGRTFGLANAAIDAFVRMDDQHIFTLVETIYRTNLNAIGVLAFNTGFSDDVSHPTLRNRPI